MTSRIHKTVVLFWFYKEFNICRDRLLFFKKFNPDVEIYGLYGGELTDLEMARDCTKGLVNDFYHFNRPENKRWKWEHGDEMLIDWYRQQGHKISFDSVFILQWDMLIFSPLETLTRTLTENQAILSGCRNLEPLKAFWPWYDTKKNQQLKSYLSDTFNYTGPLLACLFIVVILPRKFFAYYEKNNYPFDAFLEYKIPSILAAMSIEIIENEQATPFWYAERHAKFISCQKRNLIAVGQGVEPAIIAWNVNQENGRKLFHPVYISNDKVLSYIDNSSKYKITFSLLLLNVKLFCKYLIKKWF